MLGFQGSQAHLVTPVKEVLQGYQGNQGSLGLQAVQVSIGRYQELRQVWDVSTYKGITSLVLLWVLTGARLLGQDIVIHSTASSMSFLLVTFPHVTQVSLV